MRNVLVTGGTRGLGLSVCAALVEDGFRVTAVARGPNDAFREIAERVNVGEERLRFEPFDLASVDKMAELIGRVTRACGPVYGLINNAGLGSSGVLATMRDTSIEELLRLNISAPIAVTKYAVRSMMAAGVGGRIVSMSSIVATTGYGGLSVYSATKSALLGFTRSLAREVGPLNITVNAVAPGFISTEMTKELSGVDRGRIARRSALQRLAEPADVAGAVRYLLSDAARNVTGTTLTVDAGGTA